MPPARRFIPANEDVIGRVEEQDALRRAELLQLVEGGRQVGEEVAGPDVDHQRVPGRRLAAGRELGDLADQHGRQVVDDEVAEVLERVRRFRPTRS